MRTGGDKPYLYSPKDDYTYEHLKNISDKVIITSIKEPPFGKRNAIFGKGQRPLKRIGIVVFETRIQPTLDGLAGKNLIYLSESGKQIMTENFLSIWEESFKTIFPEVSYIPTSKIKKAKALSQYGLAQSDYVKAKRKTLAPDDIFFLESGKKTTLVTTLNPRGMRDVSFLLVPAYELMGGPKWSEQNKHFINDLSKELSLDAVVIVFSEISWTASHVDKHSGISISDELKLGLKASVLVPLSGYHERLEKLNDSQKPNVTLSYSSYEASLKIPLKLTENEVRHFQTIEDVLLNPLMKIYNDYTQMMIIKLTEDLKKTW